MGYVDPDFGGIRRTIAADPPKPIPLRDLGADLAAAIVSRDPARIREARRAAGLSQQQVADSLGVTCLSVSAWETGKWLPGRRIREAMAAVADPAGGSCG